jgi:23S rRNA G2445 N2-methylase RlmL
VDRDVTVAERALSALEVCEQPGLVVANPPYGERIGERPSLRNLYAQLGNVARARCRGWTLALLSTDRALEAEVKLPFEEVLRFKNGGIPVRLVRARIG